MEDNHKEVLKQYLDEIKDIENLLIEKMERIKKLHLNFILSEPKRMTTSKPTLLLFDGYSILDVHRGRIKNECNKIRTEIGE